LPASSLTWDDGVKHPHLYKMQTVKFRRNEDLPYVVLTDLEDQYSVGNVTTSSLVEMDHHSGSSANPRKPDVVLTNSTY
jgi:hypothetical protein